MTRSLVFRTAVLLLFVPFAFAAVAGAADKPKAPFEILVSDPDGGPVAEADVTISSASTVVPYSFSAKTDATGKCTGEFIEFKGVYALKVAKEGYQVFAKDLDFEATKFKKGELASIKVSLPKIPAADYYNAGAKNINEGNFAAAQANFEKAAAADPKLAIAHSALAQAHLAQADTAWLQKRKADGVLDASVDVAAESHRHAEAALAAADTALSLAPEDVAALNGRFEALSDLGRKEEAEAALGVLAEKVRTPATAVLLYNAGATASNSKDPDKAKTIAASRHFFEQAIGINPNLYQAHNGLAELAIREEKFEDAVTSLSKVIEISPRNFKAHERRIEVLKKIGDKDRIAAAEQELAKLKGGG